MCISCYRRFCNKSRGFNDSNKPRNKDFYESRCSCGHKTSSGEMIIALASAARNGNLNRFAILSILSFVNKLCFSEKYIMQILNSYVFKNEKLFPTHHKNFKKCSPYIEYYYITGKEYHKYGYLVFMFDRYLCSYNHENNGADNIYDNSIITTIPSKYSEMTPEDLNIVMSENFFQMIYNISELRSSFIKLNDNSPCISIELLQHNQVKISCIFKSHKEIDEIVRLHIEMKEVK